jgi:chromosome segregation ATPase
MTKYFDDEGNEVEFDPAEIEKLKQEAEEVKKAREELEVALKEKEEELEKLKNKDMNFKRLRDVTKEEKEKLMEQFSEKEKQIYAEVEDLRNEVSSFQTKRAATDREEILKAMAGTDEELRVKLEATEKEFIGQAHTKEELYERFRKAYVLLKEEQPKVSPLNQFVPVTEKIELRKRDVKYTDTDEGQQNFEAWFPETKKQ